MSLQRVASLAFCLLALPTVSFGYDGSQAEQEACTPDVMSLCSAYIPDEKPIVACLQSKRPQLSSACEQVLFHDARPKHRAARVQRTAQDN